MSAVRNDGATMPSASSGPHAGIDTGVGNEGTPKRCGHCGRAFVGVGRQRWCSDGCRQAAWRARRAVPRLPQPAKTDTVYECPSCEARYLGEQRCEECNTWCRRLGPGGPCPHCYEVVTLADIVEIGAVVVVAKTRAQTEGSSR